MPEAELKAQLRRAAQAIDWLTSQALAMKSVLGQLEGAAEWMELDPEAKASLGYPLTGGEFGKTVGESPHPTLKHGFVLRPPAEVLDTIKESEAWL